MNRVRSTAALFPLLLAACAGPKPEVKPVATETKAAADVSGEDPAQHARELAQALVEIDQRIDAIVSLSAEAGDDARNRRTDLVRTVNAQVKRYKTDLLAMAGDVGNPQRRAVAAKALGFSDDPAAVTALCAMLGPKESPALLTSATYSLGRLRSPQTRAELLLALVHHADPDVRSNSLLALAHVFEAKRAIGASPLDPLEQRDAMIHLEPALSDPADPLIRANAAAAVGALGDPRAVDPLLDLLRDTHPLVRMRTAIALGDLGDAKAVPALANVIDSTPPGAPRHAVVLALSALLEKLGHRPPESLGDDGHAWARWLRESMGGSDKGM